MTLHQKVKLVARILKKRVPSLSHEEAVYIGYHIVEALDKPETKVTEQGPENE